MSKYAPIAGEIPGTVVDLSGRKLVVAPLNLDQVQTVEPLLKRLGKPNDDGSEKTMAENLEESIPLILASLHRNYPDMTEEDLRSILDLGNFQIAMAAVIKVSGFSTTPRQLGELMESQNASGLGTIHTPTSLQ